MPHRQPLGIGRRSASGADDARDSQPLPSASRARRRRTAGCTRPTLRRVATLVFALAAALGRCVVDSVAVAALSQDFSTEASALQALSTPGGAEKLLREGEDGVAVLRELVNRGWFEAARRLITASHRLPDAGLRDRIATVVRREAAGIKTKCDGLLESLTVQRQVGIVTCAFQWSQNSSAIFLNVKFAHRWASPGALGVRNQSVVADDVGLVLTAEGEHSGLQKRYRLELSFYQFVVPGRLSWRMASVGHMQITIRKYKLGRWPRLLLSADRPKSMAPWPEMDARWHDELGAFPKLPARRSKGRQR